MRTHVACPVCGQQLDFVQGGTEQWGTVPVTDTGCMEVTINDGGTGPVTTHMREHGQDGSLWAAQRAYYDRMAQTRAALAARFGWDSEPSSAPRLDTAPGAQP